MELGTRRGEGESSQYPAVHGLEAVTDVGERTAEQHGHGVRHVGLRGLLVQFYGQNPLLDRHSTSAALRAAGRRRRRAPIVATVAAARAEAARGPRGEGRGTGGRGREEAEGGRGRCGSGGAAAGSGAEDGGGGAEEAREREREAERGGESHRFAVCSVEATAAFREEENGGRVGGGGGGGGGGVLRGFWMGMAG